MADIQNDRKIRTYCAQCFSNCPVTAHVENGEFTKVSPDRDHRFYRPLCPKGLAGPELVSSSQRLEYPLKRTNPKGAGDPGWMRISWEEALDAAAENMLRIREEHGAESFVFSQTNVSSPLWEITGFIRRLANIYGSPNHMTTTHICNWHRDNGSALTFGAPGDDFTAGWPDFRNSKCILLWGHNPSATLNAFNRQLKFKDAKDTRLIVIDPRRTQTASKADIWLQVKPGTDGALALGMIHIMLELGLYDDAFVRNWTNAPFLVRSDTGDLLRAASVDASVEDDNVFVMIDSVAGRPVFHRPGQATDISPELEPETEVVLTNGRRVMCRSVLALLRESVEKYTPEYVERRTSIKVAKVEEAVRMMIENSPACWYTFNGVEQNLNATQTNRAICIMYALTGDYDRKGGNTVTSPLPPLNFPFGFEFITQEMFKKNIALSKHPLGPAGTIMSAPPYLVCRAITESDPYPVKGLMVFGANTVSANPDSRMTAEALKKLEFHVHIDHFLNPTAEFADIILPSASFWETGCIGYPMAFEDNKWVLQWREPAARPRGESRDVLWIIFELAKRLGFSEHFWEGDLEAAFESMLEPTGVDLQTLKASEGGVFIQGQVAYQKYKERGFSGMTGRVELFSQLLKNIGQAPIPEWKNPYAVFEDAGISREEYPLVLINAKLREYCQSQHRALPSLRKRIPEPFLEINDRTAAKLGVKTDDPVVLETVNGEITLKAKLTEALAPDVICTQHGWWQACPELGLPGHDVYSSGGANVNLLYNADFVDPISGSIHMRGFPCRVKKI